MHLDDLHHLRDLGDMSHERQDPHCLLPEEMAALLRPTPWRRLAVLGDSIAAGVGDPVRGYRDLSWADRLSGAIATAHGLSGPGARHLDLGVPGRRARQVREDQLDRALAHAPDLAVVAAGANDALRRSFDPALVAGELDGIVGPLAAGGCLVVTFGVLDLSGTGLVPESMRADLRRRLIGLNEVSRAVARRHDGLFVDFFDHPARDDGIFSADLIHPNRRGHAHISAALGYALAGRAARGQERTGVAAVAALT